MRIVVDSASTSTPLTSQIKTVVRDMTRPSRSHTSLAFGILMIVVVTQSPVVASTEELTTQTDKPVIPELELIKEEETVSIASRYEQPISQAPSNVYVITDEDIRQWGHQICRQYCVEFLESR